jgi:hypothetical protein
MPIKIKSKQVPPEITGQPTQPVSVATGAPLIESLDIVGQTVSELGRIGGQIQQAEQRDEAARLKEEERVRAKLAKEQALKDRAEATRIVTQTKGASGALNNDYMTRELDNAKGISVEYKTTHKKLYSDAIGSASNDAVKEMIATDLQAYDITNYNKVLGKEREENVKSEKAEFTFSADTSVTAGISSFASAPLGEDGRFTPASYSNAMLTISVEEANIVDQGELMAVRSGWKDDQKNAWILPRVNKMFKESAEAIAVKDAETARLFIDQNRDKFNPAELDVLDTKVKKEDVVQTSVQIVDDLRELEPDRTKWNDIISKMKFTGTKEEQAKKRVATEKRAKTVDEWMTDSEAADKKGIYHNALNAIIRSDNPVAGEEIALTLDDPEEVVKALSINESRHKRDKREVETDVDVYAQVFEDIRNGVIKTEGDINEFYPSLSTSHYNTAISALQSKISSTKDEMTINNVKYSTTKAAYEAAMKKKYVVEDDADDLITLQEMLETEAAEKGRPLSMAESTSIARKLNVEGVLVGSGFIWDDTVKFGEAFREGKVDKFLPEISDDFDDRERKEITQALKKSGIVTDDEIIYRLYKKEELMKIELSPREVQIYRRLLKKARGR